MATALFEIMKIIVLFLFLLFLCDLFYLKPVFFLLWALAFICMCCFFSSFLLIISSSP